MSMTDAQETAAFTAMILTEELADRHAMAKDNKEQDDEFTDAALDQYEHFRGQQGSWELRRVLLQQAIRIERVYDTLPDDFRDHLHDAHAYDFEVLPLLISKLAGNCAQIHADDPDESWLTVGDVMVREAFDNVLDSIKADEEAARLRREAEQRGELSS